MPTILRVGAYRFYFYSHEGNEPPHIHIDKNECSAKFWLKPVRLARNTRYTSKELTELNKLVIQHQEFLLNGWYGYFSSSSR